MTKISNQYSLTNILTADLANSRLGINNVSPTVALDVTGAGKFSSSVTASSYISNLTSGIFLNNSSGGTNATQIRINNTSGDLRLGIESSTGGTIQEGTSAYAAVFGNQANAATQFTTNGTVRMSISSTGAATFQSVNAKVNTGQWHLSVQDNTSMAAGVGGGISFNGYKTGTTAQGLYAAIDGYKENATAGNELGGFRIWTSNGTNLVERMRITSDGKVGIGNSSPSETLDVTGSIKASSGVFANYLEGEFGQVLASVPYGSTTISKNLAELGPGIYLINAYMMRGGAAIDQTYSVMWYYMHLSGFGGGSDAIYAIYNNPGPQNNNGRIALTGAGYTVEITWAGGRGPAGVTATKIRDAY